MIRDEAAMKLARSLLEPFFQRDLVGDEGVALAASLIQLGVEIDEKDQEIARLTTAIEGTERTL